MSLHWQGGGGQNPLMRASNADRERAADVLKAGYAEGRLSKVEYDRRLSRVHQAGTYGELHTQIADLPQGPVPLPQPMQPAPPMQPAQPVPPAFWAPGPPPAPQNGSATGALVCGVLTPFTWGLTAIPAVVLGHKARAEIQRTGERGEGYATAGLVLGYLAIGFWFMVIFFGVIVAGAT